jgi:hypothetical protein
MINGNYVKTDGTVQQMEKKTSENKQARGVWRVIGRFFAVLGTTLLATIIALFGFFALIFKGPSPTARDKFVTEFSKNETLKFIPSVFLSTEELQEILEDNSKMSTQEEDVL